MQEINIVDMILNIKTNKLHIMLFIFIKIVPIHNKNWNWFRKD